MGSASASMLRRLLVGRRPRPRNARRAQSVRAFAVEPAIRVLRATVSITLDTYSHAIPAMQEQAAALIAGLVFAK